MKCAKNIEGEVAVLSLGGKLMGGPDADQVRGAIKECLDNEEKNILIDLGDVSWINSTGLGILIASHVTVTNADGNLKLSRVSKRISQIFMVTKLHTVFEAYESVKEALASFSSK